MRAKLVPRNDGEDATTPGDERGAARTPPRWARGFRPWRRSTPGTGRDDADGRHDNRARAVGLLALALVGVRIAAVPITLSQDGVYGAHARLTGDIRRFHSIASKRGDPYLDFPVEYPPVMLGVIELLDSSTTHAATVATMWSQLALDLGIAALIWWGWGRRAALAYLIIGFPLICYPFLYLRLDLLSVALAVAGLALVRRRRPACGGALLAVAAFAKLWPILLVPGLLVRRSWRALAAFTAIAVAGTAAWVAWVGTDGPVQVVSMRGATGWEIESIVGSILRATTNQVVHYNEGAFRVAHVSWEAVVLSAAVLIVGVAATWLLAGRSPTRDLLLDGAAALTAVGVFLVCTPLLSPQFAVWLVPFAAIAVAHGDRLLGRLTLLVVAFSVVDFVLIDRYANTSAVVPQVVVLARNAALIVLVAIGFGRVARAAARRRGDLAEPHPVEVTS